ncbi:hypothetical protein BH09ACT8_BH09ACT8_43580 [soil metagenome]
MTQGNRGGTPPGTPPPGWETQPLFGPSAGWQQYPPGYQGYPSPQLLRRNRRPLIITLSAVAVIAVIAVVVAVVLNGGGQNKTGAGSAQDVVKAYLDALARGDADTALSLGNTAPRSRKYVTDSMLREQLNTWPITNIVVTQDKTLDSSDTALIQAAADFGDKHSEGVIPVERVGGRWKLKSATVNIDTMAQISPGGPAGTLSVLGEPLGNDDNFDVFPGYLGIASTIPYLDVLSPPVMLDHMSAGDTGSVLTFDFTLNNAGHAAVNKALETWVIGCLANDPSLYKCPGWDPGMPFDTKTVQINGPVDLSKVTQSLLPTSTKVMVNGTASYQVTADEIGGGPAVFNSTQPISTAVDLTTDPPVVAGLK